MKDLILPTGVAKQKTERVAIAADFARERGTQGFLPAITYPVKPVYPGNNGWWSIAMTAPTSGLFVNLWQAYIPQLVHESIRCYLPVATDATASGELRLEISSSWGVSVSRAYTIPSSLNSSFLFNWLHGQPVWTTTDAFVSIQCKCIASQVNVFVPYGGGLVQREPFGATEEGVVLL